MTRHAYAIGWGVGALALCSGLVAEGCGDTTPDCALSRSCTGDGSGAGTNAGGSGSGGSGQTGGAASVGGSGGGDVTPPSVTSRSPNIDATNVPTAATVVIGFSEALDPTSVNSTTVTVENVNGPIAGSIALDGDQITFTPDPVLVLFGDYTVTLTGGVTDLADNPLADAPVSWSFTCVDGAWGDPVKLENTSQSARSPAVAADAHGNAVVIWAHQAGGINNLWANRYAAGVGWGTAQLLETSASTVGEAADVAMTPAGAAVATWDQAGAIWINESDPGAGWNGAVNVATTAAMGPQVAAGMNGDVFLIWNDNDVATHINVRRKPAGGAWESTFPLDELDAGDIANKPNIVVAPGGEAMAVWVRDTGPVHVSASHYVPGNGWDTAVPIDLLSGAVGPTPQVAVDSAGTFVAVWRQEDGTSRRVWANRYVPASGWGTAEIIDGGGGYWNPFVATEGGYAVAVWSDSANAYTPGAGWSAAISFGSISTAGDVAFDNAGHAWTVWTGGNSTGATRWTSSGWESPVTFPYFLPDSPLFDPPRVAISANGTAFSAWTQLDQSDNNTYNIWAAVFAEP